MNRRTKQDLIDSIRYQAESDLEAFITLVHPQTVLGQVHRDLIQWWNREEAKTHQLVLLPRDHGKSRMVAYRVAWEITKDPTIRVLYISSTSNLAQKQLKFIKDIITSDIYRHYWPEMTNVDEGKREKWTETEIAVDHPLRKAEAIRDPTVFTAGLTTNIVGLHCDIAVLDDVVTGQNAYKEDGRETTKQQHGLLASIQGVDAKEWVVGTRYHPNDLYDSMISREYEVFDEDGEVSGTKTLYEVFQREVEHGGIFLWPRQQRSDGKWFGFDQSILAVKRALYDDPIQFRAQYYNDPNDVSNAPITRDRFQYFEPNHLQRYDGYWYYKGIRLNVFAAVDFAFSLKKAADYTAIVVIGISPTHDIYVLDIDRFKTQKISEYYSHILYLHQKWDFRKIRAEIVSGQEVIVRDIKENYVRPQGLVLSVDEHKPTRHEGTKEERLRAVLQPRYDNLQMWHPKNHGHVAYLEEELLLAKPPHDDIKDALASAIDIAVAPSQAHQILRDHLRPRNMTHPRFGGLL